MGNAVFEADRDEIIYLWQSSFGDTPEEISFFLDSVEYEFLGLRENGMLVSQLFLLPRKLQTGEPVFYLYAACTVPECRGWGYMGELLEAAAEYSRRSEKKYIFLMPSEESLYGFYERSGYLPLCRQKRAVLNTADILKISIPDDSNMIVCDEEICHYAVKMYSDCGYKTFSNANACVIYETQGDTFSVKEWRGEGFAGAVKVLANMENCNKVLIDLSLSAEINADCEITEINHGMVLPVAGEINDGINYFLNFVLD